MARYASARPGKLVQGAASSGITRYASVRRGRLVYGAVSIPRGTFGAYAVSLYRFSMMSLPRWMKKVSIFFGWNQACTNSMTSSFEKVLQE